LLATTLTLYADVDVSPEIVHDVVAVVHVLLVPPLVAVAVYPDIAAPPVKAGAVQLTLNEPLLGTLSATPVGAPGTVAGVTGEEADEEVPKPFVF